MSCLIKWIVIRYKYGLLIKLITSLIMFDTLVLEPTNETRSDWGDWLNRFWWGPTHLYWVFTEFHNAAACRVRKWIEFLAHRNRSITFYVFIIHQIDWTDSVRSHPPLLGFTEFKNSKEKQPMNQRLSGMNRSKKNFKVSISFSSIGPILMRSHPPLLGFTEFWNFETSRWIEVFWVGTNRKGIFNFFIVQIDWIDFDEVTPIFTGNYQILRLHHRRICRVSSFFPCTGNSTWFNRIFNWQLLHYWFSGLKPLPSPNFTKFQTFNVNRPNNRSLYDSPKRLSWFW